MVLVNILVFAISLSLVIILHELGHFIMARRAGILCHEFAIGMGPVLWKKKVGETTYLVKAIPIGGYVMMSGEEVEDEVVKVGTQVRLQFEGDIVSKIIIDHENEKYEQFELITVEQVDLKGVDGGSLYINDYEVRRDAFYVLKRNEMQIAPYDRGFNGKTLWQRFWAIFAGPLMNFVLALVVFFSVNLIVGFPDMEDSSIGSVGIGYPAEGVLQEGDIIKEIEGVSVNDWETLSNTLRANQANRDVDLVVERDGNEVNLKLVPIIYFYTMGFHSDEETVDALIVGEVPEGTKAYEAGLQDGDELVSINGVVLTDWQSVVDVVVDLSKDAYQEGREIAIVVNRDGQEKTLQIVEPFTGAFLSSQNLNVIDSVVGISPEYSFDLGRSVTGAFTNLGNSASMIFTTIELLFDNTGAGAGIGVDNLAGPVGIYSITSAALANGFISLLSWIGLLSVNLGIINLLPLPALDGGRLVFLGYEAITRRKPNRKFENTLNYVVFILLMGFFVFVTYNDILRLFN